MPHDRYVGLTRWSLEKSEIPCVGSPDHLMSSVHLHVEPMLLDLLHTVDDIFTVTKLIEQHTYFCDPGGQLYIEVSQSVGFTQVCGSPVETRGWQGVAPLRLEGDRVHMVHLCECKLELSEGTSSTTVIVSGKGTVCSNTCKQSSSAFFPQHCSFRDVWNHLQSRRYFVSL